MARPGTNPIDARYARIIKPDRFKPSSRGPLPLPAEAESDRARILYSSAFRRLQQKTQVYPLVRNAAVRSRLTHSLEVAHVGRSIAETLTRSLLSSLKPERREALPVLVETACLMHDLGNPPFGHFAEVAIQRWLGDEGRRCLDCSLGKRTDVPRMDSLLQDFAQFDGNPQGIRIVARLQGRNASERAAHGMNLMYSQLLTGLKYPRSPSDDPIPGVKKPGFFESERDRVEEAWARLGMTPGQRLPLSYIVEAADDIAYSASDLEDGIEQNNLSPGDFFTAVVDDRSALRQLEPLARLVTKANKALRSNATHETMRNHFFDFKRTLTRTLITRATSRYSDRHDQLLEGRLPALFGPQDEERRLLDLVKRLATRFLYTSRDVEQPLRIGLRVINGLLDGFSAILRLSRTDFEALRKARKSANMGKVRASKHDPEMLVFGMLPPSYVEAYRHQSQMRAGGEWEWYSRTHLVLDCISGMTDDYALRVYHSLAGVA